MPCASTPNADYPDYLKGILKEIEVGNDNTLKDCACALRIPVTDEGCPILDEDGKSVVYPFCTIYSENGAPGWAPGGPSYPSYYPYIKLTHKEAMELYWKTKSIKWNVNYTICQFVVVDGYYTNAIVCTKYTEVIEMARVYGDQTKACKQKELVCFPGWQKINGPFVDNPNFFTWNLFQIPTFDTSAGILIDNTHTYVSLYYDINFGDESDGITSDSEGSNCDWCHNECPEWPDCPNCSSSAGLVIKGQPTQIQCYYSDMVPIQKDISSDATINTY